MQKNLTALPLSAHSPAMPLHIIKRPSLTPYLSGKELLGDDATPAELDAWFQQEVVGYADLVANDPVIYDCPEISSALNRRHFRNHLAGKSNLVGLVYGPAQASELKTLTPYFKQWYAVEPAKVFHDPKLYARPVTFLQVNPKGTLDLPDNSVDVVYSLSVLHHIANVSFVLSEIARVLKPGGFVFLREPTVTMGEWGTDRPGLTPNERGLPHGWLLKACAASGLTVMQDLPAVFPPLDRLARRLGVGAPYTSRLYMALDSFLSTLMAPFARYHRPRLHQRFAPAAVLLVAKKAG